MVVVDSTTIRIAFHKLWIDFYCPVEVCHGFGVVAEIAVRGPSVAIDRAVAIRYLECMGIEGDAVSPVRDLAPCDAESDRRHKADKVTSAAFDGTMSSAYPERPMR